MIPKIIHYCWFGGKPLPELGEKCLASWKKYCPDYEIVRWDESNYDISGNMYMKQAYEQKKWGFVPDYARLDIIYRHGGVYLDTDVEMIRSFDDLLDHRAFMGVEEPGIVALGLGFGAESGNEIIGQLLRQYDGLSFINEDGTLNMVPSPTLQMPVFESLGVRNTEDTQVIGDDCVIYAKDYFCPKDNYTRDTIITGNTYSVHHYDASWCSDKTRYYLAKREKHSQNIAMFMATAKYDGFASAVKDTMGKVFRRK